MSSPVSGDKYILFLPPAVENMNRIDNSLSLKIKRQITNFQSEWNPSMAFSKEPRDTGTENLAQIKHERGVMRAFAAWWNEKSIHVLCVLVIYKKGNEDAHWRKKDDYDRKAEKIFEELTDLHAKDELRGELEELDETDDHCVIPP